MPSLLCSSRAALLLFASLASAPVTAQAPPLPSPGAPVGPEPKLLTPPIRIPSPGGEVVITTDRDQNEYAEVKYAPGRRAGDFIFLSGRVAGIRPGAPFNLESYKVSVRRLFETAGRQLRAQGADFKDVVMIHSFHVFRNGQNGPENKLEQFEAFSAVKDQFMPGPHPAWTAVGVEALLADGGLTEAEFVAYAPLKKR